jgi:RNA polymerase sigma factor (sigma-70 family)
LRVASALVGPADAEDVAQEAVVRAWRAWDTLRDAGSVRPWLLRITVNICRQWRRGGFGRRVRLVGPLPGENSELLAALDTDPGASDHVGAIDVRTAVNALDEDLRVIVALRYYAGMDATEVGAALGIPPATVRTRLKRALTRLRHALAISDEQRVERFREGGRP